MQAQELTAGLNGHTRRNGRPEHNGHSAPSARVSDGAKGASQSQQADESSAGRTATGTFAKGNKCGLGNPFARRLGALRKAFLDSVSDADVASVAHTLRDRAAAGDVAAAQLFLSYALGKPVRVVEPDRLDLDEFALIDAAPTKARVIAILLQAADPAGSASMYRSIIPSDMYGTAEAIYAAMQEKLGLPRILDEVNARTGKAT